MKQVGVVKKSVATKKFTTKSFRALMETRLTKEEIAEIEREAMLEVRALRALQRDVTAAMNNYMEEKNIGFNELVKRLGVSPAHVAKIKKGAANLTLASVARLFSLLGQEPHLVFNKK